MPVLRTIRSASAILFGGICLRGCGGVKKDLDEAEKWFRKAADGGLIMAKEALEILEARK